MGVATIFATGGTSLLVLSALDLGLGAASLYVNYQQGDTLGMLFDVAGLGLGIGAAFKSGYQFLSSADGCASGFRGFAGRLMGNGGGCFRGSTITYRLTDVAGNSESLVAELKPLMIPDDDQSGAMAACLLIGVGGFAWQRQRKRKKEEENERRAIDSVFGESPQDDGLWT